MGAEAAASKACVPCIRSCLCLAPTRLKSKPSSPMRPPDPPTQPTRPLARPPACLPMPQEFASQVCPLAENAGQFLVQAFATGGDQAKVAAYVLTRASVCGNQTASDAALNAFMAACVTTERQRALQ